jgi:SAM-dependent methyltransferase
MTDDNTTADYWGSKYFDSSFNRTEWQAHPHALERLFKLQDGMMREDWFAKCYLGGQPAKHALGIGVGRAETEIGLLAKGYVENYDLYDVSSAGLDYAKETAARLGFADRVTCHCCDIATTKLPFEHFDLVTFVASLHHMPHLEETLWAVNHTLKPDGILWAANEYIGPDRFGYPDRHLALVRPFFSGLPSRFRKHGLESLPLPTPEEVALNDPTEAPCSSRIIPEMQRIFPRLEVKQLYGSFAFMIFWGLEHDALYETSEGGDLVKLIMSMDQGLVDNGVLPGYFAHLIARRTTAAQERAIRLGLHPRTTAFRALQKARAVATRLLGNRT